MVVFYGYGYAAINEPHLISSNMLFASCCRLDSCNPDVINAQVESLGEVIKKIASAAIRSTQLDIRWQIFL